jgi:hypothetical protein
VRYLDLEIKILCAFLIALERNVGNTNYKNKIYPGSGVGSAFLLLTSVRGLTFQHCRRVAEVEIDKRYQLDATIVIYYQKLSLHVWGIYKPIFRSTG